VQVVKCTGCDAKKGSVQELIASGKSVKNSENKAVLTLFLCVIGAKT
jgi:hypothetical protein